MARSHAQIHVSVWADPDFRGLTMQAQWAYMALISQKETTHAGTAPLMVRKWSRLCADGSAATIEEALAELERAQFVFWDEDTDEVLVRSFIRNDGVARQPNVLKSAVKCIGQIESPKLRRVACGELSRVLDGLPECPESAAMVQVIALIRDCLQSLSVSLPDLRERTPAEPFREGFAEPFREPFTEGSGEGEEEGEGEGERSLDARDKSEPTPLPGIVPDDWQPSGNTRRWANMRYANILDIDDEVTKFVAHAQDKGRITRNPDAAFKGWLVNAKQFAERDTAARMARGPRRRENTLEAWSTPADPQTPYIEAEVVELRRALP